VKIMGICGSYDLDSANGRLLEIFMTHCRDLGAETSIWDNSACHLPLVGEEGCWSDSNVEDFQAKATSMDAFVLSSPEYHGTMSGVMKNNLDWLYSKHTSGKLFALMSTLGGQSSNNTLNHMRIAARWIHGWVIPEQVAVPNVKNAFNDDGEIIDEGINERIKVMAESLISNTIKLRR